MERHSYGCTFALSGNSARFSATRMQDTDLDIEMQQWNALRGGDASAFKWIYERYFKVLYNYGRKINATKVSVEDAIQDVFVDLWRLHKNLASTTSIRFYLYRSLRRRLADKNNIDGFVAYRGIVRDDLLLHMPSKEEDLIDKETQNNRVHQLKRLLHGLSPRQYEAMILKFYDELSFEEIGVILNVNEQSARNLVQRGLVQLKQYSKPLHLFIALVSVFGLFGFYIL